MDSQIETSPVISSPPLDTTIAYNETKSSPACDVCRDLELIHILYPQPGDWTLEDLSIEDYEENKDSCPSCALLWTISVPYQHLTVPHKTTAETGFVKFELTPEEWLWMTVYDPARGLLYLEVSTTTGHTCPFPIIKRLRMMSKYTGSNQSMALISHWIQECVQGHQNCNAIRLQTSFPKRLVEILGPEKVVLRTINTDTVESYVALSHCWGTERFIQTTKSTLLPYQEQISWGNLPRTFKNAVETTRRLGMRYIWIDSLCIVQDDVDDWREEGSKMASIYSGSYLTIAASKSPDSAGGCFARYTDDARTYELVNTKGQIYNITVRKELGHPKRYGNPNFPIFDRAWVLQERLLSPRTVHFGPQELLWECNELTTCECKSWKALEFSDSKAYIMGSEASASPENSLAMPATRWQTLITEYSKLRLSDERDIFPAIQGIAKYFHKEVQCAYYAGLWERSLIQDLLWYRPSGGIHSSKSNSWRAPTWSWASTSHVFWADSSNWQALATVVAISTIPVGSDPYGQISGGELQLKGCCIDAMAVTGTKIGRSIFLLKIANKGRDVVFEEDEYNPDHSSFLRSNTTVKLLEMTRASESRCYSLENCYLILQCVDEEQQVYERIGLVTILRMNDDKRWRHKSQWHFEHYGEELVLTIV